MVIGNQDGSAVSFQSQSDKTIQIDPHSFGLNIETMDFEENNENNQGNITIRNKDVIELHFKENTEENLRNQKERHDLGRAINDSPIGPPVGKVN